MRCGAEAEAETRTAAMWLLRKTVSVCHVLDLCEMCSVRLIKKTIKYGKRRKSKKGRGEKMKEWKKERKKHIFTPTGETHESMKNAVCVFLNM